MIFLYYLGGFLLNSIVVYLSYDTQLVPKPWNYVIGMSAVALSVALWLNLSNNTHDKETLLMYGVYWDIMIAGAFIGLPVILFGIKLSHLTLFGISLIFVGIVLANIGSH